MIAAENFLTFFFFSSHSSQSPVSEGTGKFIDGLKLWPMILLKIYFSDSQGFILLV